MCDSARLSGFTAGTALPARGKPGPSCSPPAPARESPRPRRGPSVATASELHRGGKPPAHAVLNNYGLNLSESEPGNLALTSFQFCHCMEAAFCKLEEPDEFLSTLITHHGRIEILSWSDKLVKVIGNILSSPEACPQHLVLDARSKLSGPSLHLLNESLRAVTCSVRTLTLVVSHGIGPSIGDLFCPILSRAWTITALKLQLHKVTLSHGFLNPEWPGGIHFGYPQGECESDDWPTHQMGKIGTVARKKIGDEYDCCCQGILSLALCLRHNATVTSFDIDGMRVDFPGFVVSRSTTRNLSMLNDAVRFVIYESLDKNRALAFENLADYPSLRDQLTKLTGMSEAVCAAAIESANSWLRKMFFVITGVVCSSVKCHSSQRVQLDALSDSCVQGITRYLSVTDVKDEE
ncbi:uncharacterized protein LOC144148513 [Haemaphysalis longicornis]